MLILFLARRFSVLQGLRSTYEILAGSTNEILAVIELLRHWDVAAPPHTSAITLLISVFPDLHTAC